jgi:hypothetical protein
LRKITDYGTNSASSPSQPNKLIERMIMYEYLSNCCDASPFDVEAEINHTDMLGVCGHCGDYKSGFYREAIEAPFDTAGEKYGER